MVRAKDILIALSLCVLALSTHHVVESKTYSLSLVGIPNVLFVGQISIGTPGQYFYMAIDTGSSVSWIASTDCKTDMCQERTLFNISKSSSYVDIKVPYQLSEGDKTVSGKRSQDTMTIAGVKITNQPFVWVNGQIDTATKLSNYDGVIGLAYGLLEKGYGNPVDMASAQGKIDNRIFSLWLQRIKDKDDGELTLGGINSKRYTGTTCFD